MTNLAAASLTESSTLKNRISRAATLIIALSLLSFLTSCAVNPATGSANLVLMSESREKEIGLEEHEKVLASMPLLEDEVLLAYVREVGNKAAAVSHRPELDYTLSLIHI